NAPPSTCATPAFEGFWLNDIQATDMVLDPSTEGGFVTMHVAPNDLQNPGTYNFTQPHEYGSGPGTMEDSMLAATAAVATTSPPTYPPIVDTGGSALDGHPAHHEASSLAHGHSASLISPSGDFSDNDSNMPLPNTKTTLEWMDVPLVPNPTVRGIRSFIRSAKKDPGGHVREVVCSLCALWEGATFAGILE
ncbi:hypothetical protein FRC11_001180, partial [Ceratobasidium sp. 423]